MSLHFPCVALKRFAFLQRINQGADNKILTLSRSNVAKMLQNFFDKFGIIGEKGENPGPQHFLYFQQCFLQASLHGSLKVGIVQ